jgi:predicted nucleic acid-binding protein
MSGVLVDSDILIEVLRGRKPEVARLWTELVNGNQPLVYSPVSLAEIRQGMRTHERESVQGVFSSMICVPIDVEIASRAGDYLRTFHASHAVELGDALIAATASIHQIKLWTQNRKHFPMKDIALYA